MRASTEATARFMVSSTSANTGVAPAWTIEFAVAMNDRLGQMTSSPGPMPSATKVR